MMSHGLWIGTGGIDNPREIIHEQRSIMSQRIIHEREGIIYNGSAIIKGTVS